MPCFSYLYTSRGPQLAWAANLLMMSFTLLLWLIMYRRMVPLQVVQRVPTRVYSINIPVDNDPFAEQLGSKQFSKL